MQVSLAARRADRAAAPAQMLRKRQDSSARPAADTPAQRRLVQMQAALNLAPAARAGAAARYSLNGGVTQLAKLNIRSNGTISGVSAWPHRPASNVSGKQGQHLTAYVAFEDMILSHVRDRTPKQAANALIDLLGEMRNLPGGDSWEFIYGSTTQINIGLLNKTAKNNDGDLVGDVIDNILALRNVMPDTAVGTAEKTPGHGEAKTSGSLEVLETILRQNEGELPEKYNGDVEANAALFNMWRLLDYQPSTGAGETAFDKTKMRVLRHVMQMRLSYPQVFEWLSDRKSWLMPYIRANRGEDGMPLSHLSNKEIDAITEHVHGNL